MLEPKLSRLAIVVPHAAPGLEIRRDGERVGEAQWGDLVPIDPGAHTVVATAPGKRAFEVALEIGAPANTAKVIVPELEGETAAAPINTNGAENCTAAQPAFLPAPAPRSNALAWALVSVGAASLAGGAVMWVVRGNEIAKLENACGDGGKSCPPSASEDIANGKTYTVLGIGLFAMGAVSAGVGSALLLTGSNEKRSVHIAPTGRGITVSGRF